MDKWRILYARADGEMSALQPVVILGAGDFGRDVADIIADINDRWPRYQLLGFLDKVDRPSREFVERGHRLLGPDEVLESLDAHAVIAIASPHIRRRLDEYTRSVGRDAPVVVHPDATIAPDARLGPGTVVSAGARVGANVTTGRHVHLNLNCTVGHDSVLDDYVTLNPQSAVSAKVCLHEQVTMAAGSVVIQGLSVGAHSTVGPGSAALRDVGAATTVLGVPARPVFATRSSAKPHADHATTRRDTTQLAR